MKIYSYLRGYFILLLASQLIIFSVAYIIFATGCTEFTTWNIHGETITLSIDQFQFLIIWIVNLFVVWFIKNDFDRNKISAPWVLLLTMFTSSSGIVMAWLLLHVANREQSNEHTTTN